MNARTASRGGRARAVAYAAVLCAVFFLGGEAAVRGLQARGYLAESRNLNALFPVRSWQDLFDDPTLLNTRYGARDAAVLMRVQHATRTLVIDPTGENMRAQRVPLDAPPGQLRILFLGGSSVYGFIYPRGETSFPAFVEDRLASRWGEGRVRCVNGGIGAGTSARCLQILGIAGPALHPGIVVVYSGHNDGYPLCVVSLPDLHPDRKMSWVVAAYRRSALLRLGAVFFRHGTKARLQREEKMIAAFEAREKVLDEPTARGLRRLRVLVDENYRSNLERIVRAARKDGARVLLLSVTSNLLFGEEGPRVHRPDFPRARLADFEAGMAEVDALYRGQRFEEMIPKAERLLAIDDSYVHLRFLLGKALAACGRTDEALVHLRAARDLPLAYTTTGPRAPTSRAAIVEEVAEQEGAAFLNVEETLLRRPDYWTQCESWFADNLHLSVRGQQLMADLIVGELERLGWVPGPGRAAEHR